uniref:G_PROTEIN_RECEP_F1_2 domain-containing protein n=1 Tax=Ascaris lumbricoides TaxID=6252 RepID=A0A0M3HHF0_ASCLU
MIGDFTVLLTFAAYAAPLTLLLVLFIYLIYLFIYLLIQFIDFIFNIEYVKKKKFYLLEIFANVEWFKNDELNRFMGQLNISAYVACTYTHLVRSSCRFMAISYPINHSRIFTMHNTIMALLLIWIFAILQTVVYYIGKPKILIPF